jgi:hypothetical protein
MLGNPRAEGGIVGPGCVQAGQRPVVGGHRGVRALAQPMHATLEKPTPGIVGFAFGDRGQLLLGGIRVTGQQGQFDGGQQCGHRRAGCLVASVLLRLGHERRRQGQARDPDRDPARTWSGATDHGLEASAGWRTHIM